MLAYLARHPGEFVDYPRLLALVASTSEAHGHAALRHLARGLRRKLDAPVLEVTVGVGWRLAVPTVMSQAATGPAA
jgi:DNA-binding response OmpR family regulator